MGFFSSIGKLFKRVTSSTIGKIAVGVFLGAAIIYTGGAALGLTGMAGGWAGAAGSITSSLGLSGTMGSVVTGALTQAGYGAMIGGGLSLLTGQDPLQGAAMGALGGAVTGGITGAVTGLNAAAAGASGSPAVTGEIANATLAAEPIAGSASQLPALPGAATTTSTTTGAATGAATGTSTGAATGTGAATSAGTGGVQAAAGGSAGGTINTGSAIADRILNSDKVLGEVIGGLGKGAMGYMSQSGEEEMQRDEQRRMTGSYDIDYSQLQADPNATGIAGQNTGARPSSRYATNKEGRRRYRFDPAQGRVIEERV